MSSPHFFQYALLVIHSISAIAVIFSVYFLVKKIHLLIKNHKENHLWQRRIETKKILDTYNRLDSVMNLHEQFKYLSSKHSIENNIILDCFKSNEKMRVELVRLLNLYEGIAIGIR